MIERVIKVSMTPDTDPDNLQTPYFYVVLELCSSTWVNTICGWKATPEEAFASAVNLLNENFPNHPYS